MSWLSKQIWSSELVVVGSISRKVKREALTKREWRCWGYVIEVFCLVHYPPYQIRRMWGIESLTEENERLERFIVRHLKHENKEDLLPSQNVGILKSHDLTPFSLLALMTIVSRWDAKPPEALKSFLSYHNPAFSNWAMSSSSPIGWIWNVTHMLQNEAGRGTRRFSNVDQF